MPVWCDRGDIIHEAGRRRLSPALLDGAPALVGVDGEAAVRCGWAEFFAALEGRELAVELGEAGDPSVRFVPRAAGRRPRASPGARIRAAAAEARRFAAALLGRERAS